MNIENNIIANNTTIIAITPVQPSVETSLLPNDIIIPASTTPSATAVILVLNPRFKILATRVPVHAPVPGNGMPTNNSNAQNVPFVPADSFNLFPPFSPFSKHHVKNFFVYFLSFSVMC